MDNEGQTGTTLIRLGFCGYNVVHVKGENRTPKPLI
jgi:hypothetical protein